MPITLIPSPADTVTKDGRTSLYTVTGHSDIQTIHFDVEGVTTQTAYMLIDLSNTTQWAHENTGHIYIHYIIIAVDPDSSYFGEVNVGFLTNVDGTNGDFNRFVDVDMARKSDQAIYTFDFAGYGFECETAHHFGPITANSTLFQTDADLLGPDGDADHPSGAGDVVAIIEASAGTVDISVTIGYESVA